MGEPTGVSLLTVILAVIMVLLLAGCGGLQNTRTPISSDEDAVAVYETLTRRLLKESGGVQGTLHIGQSTPVLGGAPTTAAPGTFSAVVEGGLADALANTADKVVWLAMGQAGDAELPGSDGGVIVTLSEIAFDPKRSDLYWGASREMWIHDLGVVNGKEGGVYVFDARDRLVDSLQWAATP